MRLWKALTEASSTAQGAMEIRAVMLAARSSSRESPRQPRTMFRTDARWGMM